MFERDQHSRAVEHRLGQRPALAGLAKPFRARLVECQPRMAARWIKCGQRLTLHPRLIERHDNQRQPLPLTRQNNCMRGDVAVSDRDLHAGKPRSIEARFNTVGRWRTRTFRDRERADQLAADKLRQQGLLLRC